MIQAIKNFRTSVNHISDRINDTLLPAPTTASQKLCKRQREIEESANDIRTQLKACVKLAQTYDVFDRICDFKIVWGDSAQVSASYNSLLLALHIKQNAILQNL